MIKIGEFSKLSHLTIKALRFYEKEELLVPAYIDSQTNYRYYNTSQLQLASKIKAYRQIRSKPPGVDWHPGACLLPFEKFGTSLPSSEP